MALTLAQAMAKKLTPKVNTGSKKIKKGGGSSFAKAPLRPPNALRPRTPRQGVKVACENKSQEEKENEKKNGQKPKKPAEKGGRKERNKKEKLFPIKCLVMHDPPNATTHGGVKKYLVRWEGYPPSSNTWEPADIIWEDAKTAVDEYWA